jgi:hypothetical protein
MMLLLPVVSRQRLLTGCDIFIFPVYFFLNVTWNFPPANRAGTGVLIALPARAVFF